MLGNISQHAYTWVAYYLAGFCLVTIAVWAGWAYLWSTNWRKQVRDSAVYLATIGGLALMLALKPNFNDAVLWQPLTWFCFTMLMVIELLWLSYLCDSLYHSVRAMVATLSQRSPHATANIRSEWRRSYPR